MYLPSLCIRRPVFTIVINLLLITIGLIALSKLEIRGNPDIDPPIINIQFEYEGADAEYMEQEIATRVEKALRTVKNVDFITSNSDAGETNIVVSFRLGADIEIALNDIRSKVNSILDIFPDDLPFPRIAKFDSDSFPSFWISINSDRHNQLELTDIVNRLVRFKLERLPSVGSSRIFGSRDYTMRIEPENAKMFMHRVSPLEIEQAVRAQNRDYPAGKIRTSSRDYSIKLAGLLQDTSDFANVIIKNNGNGSVVKVDEVANVGLKPLSEDVILRYEGKRSLALGLIKQSSANIISMSDNIRQNLDDIKSFLPKGVQIEIAYDAAVPLRASVKAVFITIFEAVILVSIITYLFLGSLRLTLIPLATIPISLIATFGIFLYFGFSINNFTLLAMILAIGLVVDDAIVMLENISRHYYELGKDKLQAAHDGAGQIAFAVIAMTITLAAVFLPVGFSEGFISIFFTEFAWTLAFCVLFSGFVALTLSPMMASKLLNKQELKRSYILAKFDQIFDYVRDTYLLLLKICFKAKIVFWLVCLSSLVLLVLAFKATDKAFVPEEDQAFLQMSFTGPEGSSLEHTEKAVVKAEEILGMHKDVLGYFVVVGAGGSDSAFAFVPLLDWQDRKKSQTEIMQELNSKLSEIPEMSIFVIPPRSIGGGGSGQIVQFNITSSLPYQQIYQQSIEFKDALANSGLFTDLEIDFKASTPTLDIKINRERAYRYGVDLSSIGNTVQYLLAGRAVGDFRLNNEIYQVVIRYSDEERNNISDLKKINIKNNDGQMLPIEAVADIVETISVRSYKRYNNQRAIGVSSNLAEGVSLGEAVDKIEELGQALLYNNNSTIEYEGEIKRLKESDDSLLMIFAFALVFIFLVLSAQFESFADSLLILCAVPFSITGGILTLWLFDNTINMYSNIGLVTLIGLVTKNSIMLVEFTSQLREEGYNKLDALLQATKLRFRPILMTSMATIAGAMPLVFASGAGAAARNSIGLVIVGGFSVGTIFTMFVIPMLYFLFKSEKI